MKRLILTCLIVLAAATTAWSMNLRQGYGKYRYGDTCEKFPSPETWSGMVNKA